MEIAWRRLTDRTHRVSVRRDDGTTDEVELSTKDFLRHDLAHYVVESVLGIRDGVWGSVAAGGSLDGTGLDGTGVAQAERLAGPVQTLMRTDADAEAFRAVLDRVSPSAGNGELAAQLHHRARAVTGAWRATPFHDELRLTWPPADPPASERRR